MSGEYHEYLGNGDEERNMMDYTLTWSMRVLEMVASREKVEPCMRSGGLLRCTRGEG